MYRLPDNPRNPMMDMTLQADQANIITHTCPYWETTGCQTSSYFYSEDQ